MFGNTPKNKEFTYTTSKSLRPDKVKDIRERMKFTSYTSQDVKQSKKKLIFFAVLFILSLFYILRFGLIDEPSEKGIILNENELEKANEQ